MAYLSPLVPQQTAFITLPLAAQRSGLYLEKLLPGGEPGLFLIQSSGLTWCPSQDTVEEARFTQHLSKAFELTQPLLVPPYSVQLWIAPPMVHYRVKRKCKNVMTPQPEGLCCFLLRGEGGGMAAMQLLQSHHFWTHNGGGC